MTTGSIPLIGYTDRLSAGPGETIEFKVSSRSDRPFGARLVRVVCGDPNPDGPGIKEIEVASEFEGSWPSRAQDAHLGSYARVDGARPGGGAMTVVATVWPTLPELGGQGIVSWLAGSSGLALVLDGERGAVLRAGVAGDGTVEEVAVGKPLRARTWYRVWASIDPDSRTVAVGQASLDASPVVDDSGSARRRTERPLAAAGAGALFIAAGGGEPVGGHFNGKVERPYIAGSGPAGIASPPPREPDPASPVIADWDFSREIPSQRVVDTGPNGWHGALVNLPARAMKGSAWTGDEHCWRHAPDQYGAIHFHDDDLHDCDWETDFTYTVPDDLPSGAYAARLTCGDHQDMIPFFVRPRLGEPGGPICVLVPTFTYTVYANYSRGLTNDAYRARAREWGASDRTADDHREYGLSTYNFHRDGSGIGYASRLRPILNLRSAFLAYVDERGSGLRHYPADTHLFDWLEACGYRYDVVTDEDLHRHGTDLIAPYQVVLTTSHPEYHTARTLDALEQFLGGGGRLVYLGGNGFYWRVALHDDVPGAVEIRRAEGGIRAWAAEPGSTTTPSTASTEVSGAATTAPRNASREWGFRARDNSSARTTCASRGRTTRGRRGSSRGCRTASSATSASPAEARPASSSTGWTTASALPPTR